MIRRPFLSLRRPIGSKERPRVRLEKSRWPKPDHNVGPLNALSIHLELRPTATKTVMSIASRRRRLELHRLGDCVN